MPPERPSLPSSGATIPPMRTAEQRALEAAHRIPGESILCTTVGRAQAAGELTRQRPAASVCCWLLDDYQRELARAAYGDAAANLDLVCQADAPEATIDLAVVPLSKTGEAEL